MKKLIAIAAVAALGIGAAAPATASPRLERYNYLVGLQKGEWTKAECQRDQEILGILEAVKRDGAYFGSGEDDGGAEFRANLANSRSNNQRCISKGLLPTPRTAPVAQRGYSSSTSAAVDNWMCTSVAGSMGSPLEAAMMAGMAGCSDSQTAAAMNASSRKNDWCRARGYSNGWVDGRCQGGNNASYGRSEMGLPGAW